MDGCSELAQLETRLREEHRQEIAALQAHQATLHTEMHQSDEAALTDALKDQAERLQQAHQAEMENLNEKLRIVPLAAQQTSSDLADLADCRADSGTRDNSVDADTGVTICCDSGENDAAHGESMLSASPSRFGLSPMLIPDLKLVKKPSIDGTWQVAPRGDRSSTLGIDWGDSTTITGIEGEIWRSGVSIGKYVFSNLADCTAGFTALRLPTLNTDARQLSGKIQEDGRMCLRDELGCWVVFRRREDKASSQPPVVSTQHSITSLSPVRHTQPCPFGSALLNVTHCH